MAASPQPKAKPWDVWVKRLSSEAQQVLAGKKVYDCPDTNPEFVQFMNGLQEPTRTYFERHVPEEQRAPAPAERTELYRYGCVEVLDGEWPMLRIFKSPESLGRYIASLEGKDAVVIPFHGVPLRYTVGPQRYMFLPDGSRAMLLPFGSVGPTKRVDADLITMDLQEDFFLGPPELAVTEIASDLLRIEKPVKRNKRRSDEPAGNGDSNTLTKADEPVDEEEGEEGEEEG